MRLLQLLLVVLALISLSACGGGNSLTITLTPSTATVATSQNQQFTATVTNATNSAVNWEVNGIVGGASSIGTISTGGLYTAPTTVPNPAAVSIFAVSAQNANKMATATVTVVLGANLAISPSSLNLGAGGQQTFTVSSNGAAITGETYSLTCQSSVSGACGSVTADGVYTAPSAPPPGNNVILTVSYTNASGTFTTSASITIQGSAQATAGQYAFTLAGSSNGAPYHAAGSIALDGNGNVTGGAEDVNANGAVSSVTIKNGGTYQYSTVTRHLTINATDSNNNALTLYATLANNTQGYVEYGVAGASGSGTSASGTFALQTPSQFNAGAINGSYAFRLAGMNPGAPATAIAEVGAFSANGSGGITGGLLDANSAGAVSGNQAITGTVTAPDANGRGALTLTSGFGTQSFACYVIDGTHLKLVETDGAHSISGDALLQSGAPFSTSSFHGTVALVLNGMSASGTLGIGGLVSIAGGNFGGAIDVNNAGSFDAAPYQTGQTLSGSYSVSDASTGRTPGTISLSGGASIPVVLYPLSSTSFYVLDADPANVASGPALVSSGVNGSSLQGTYVAALTGVVFASPTLSEDVVGALSANGGGAFTGSLDITDTTNGHTGTSLLSSPYSIAGTPTATLKSSFANFGSVGFNLYIVDGTQSFFLENDNKGVLTGAMESQQ